MTTVEAARPQQSRIEERFRTLMAATIKITHPRDRRSRPSQPAAWFSVSRARRWRCPPQPHAHDHRRHRSRRRRRCTERALARVVEQDSRTRLAPTPTNTCDKLGTGDIEERHARFTRHGTRQQRLACAWLAVEQDALGDLGADRLELRRLGQELLDLLQLLDRLVTTGDVAECGLGRVLVGHLGLGLAELHHAAAAALHRVEQEEEQDTDDDERDQRAQQGAEEARSLVLAHPPYPGSCPPRAGSAARSAGRSGSRPRSPCSRSGQRPSA